MSRRFVSEHRGQFPSPGSVAWSGFPGRASISGTAALCQTTTSTTLRWRRRSMRSMWRRGGPTGRLGGGPAPQPGTSSLDEARGETHGRVRPGRGAQPPQVTAWQAQHGPEVDPPSWTRPGVPQNAGTGLPRRSRRHAWRSGMQTCVMPTGLDGNPSPVVTTARTKVLDRVADQVVRRGRRGRRGRHRRPVGVPASRPSPTNWRAARPVTPLIGQSPGRSISQRCCDAIPPIRRSEH